MMLEKELRKKNGKYTKTRTHAHTHFTHSVYKNMINYIKSQFFHFHIKNERFHKHFSFYVLRDGGRRENKKWRNFFLYLNESFLKKKFINLNKIKRFTFSSYYSLLLLPIFYLPLFFVTPGKMHHSAITFPPTPFTPSTSASQIFLFF